MTGINWDRVAVPGVTPGAQYFRIPGGRKDPVRLAFIYEAGLSWSAGDLLCFSMRSPSSSAMYPDILRGDHGYPTISLTNANGTVFSFARGNIKDFFDISAPNKMQEVRLPLGSFLFDIYLKNNPPPDGSFFDAPIVKATFDFLSHPDADIDMEVGNVRAEPGPAKSALNFETVIKLSKRPEHGDLPMMAADDGRLSLAAELSDPDQYSQLLNRPLYWAVYEGETAVAKGHVFLKQSPVSLDICLPKLGAFELRLRIEVDGVVVSSSRRPIVCLPIAPKRQATTILGVSDEFDYNSIAAFGGSFERLPVQLQAVSADGEGGFSFNKGANPFPLPTLSAHRCRMIAAFAMPRWLSSRPDRKDYYRYAPNDWDVYGNLVKWLTREAVANGVTHIEVWNEASVIGHWGDTMDNLIRLHQSSYEAIKSIAPQITVLGGCTHTWHFRFLRDFFENDGGSWCDGISVHGYTYQPHRRKEYFDELEALMEEFKPRNDWPSFKAHITEIGFRVPAYSEREQARQLLLFTLEAATRSRIGSVLWFRFMNKMKEDLSAYKQRASTGYAMIGNSEMYCREALLAYRLADIVLQSDLAPSEISRLLDGSFGAGVAPLSSPEVWSTLQNMLNLSDN